MEERPMPARILIVDPNDLLRMGLHSLLASSLEFTVVGEMRDGKGAISESIALQPDIVLMEIALPGMNGMEAAVQIKRRLSDVHIVMFTSFRSEEYLRESLKLGADGYLLKSASYDELLVALRSVARGKKYLSPDVSGRLVDGFLNPGRPRTDDSPLTRLTSRERSVLQLIAEGRTNRSTAEFLSVSPKTVEKHRARLMHKLGLRNVAELTLTALEMGLIQRPGTISRLVDDTVA
jgi:DNA-binding NarL/FixJ family response regulator